MGKPFTFIFRITSLCDKACEACCNGQQNATHISMQQFIKKLDDIQRFVESEELIPIIGLTGGEPFLYVDSSHSANIGSLVNQIHQRIPLAEIVMRTAGWAPHPILDDRLISLFKSIPKKQLNISFGFNLFQKQGVGAKTRFNHMLKLLLAYQDRVILDVIYNRLNLEKTMDLIEEELADFNFRYRGIRAHILSQPSTPHRFTSRHRENQQQIIMDAYPAYNACQQSNQAHFFDENISCGVCHEINTGPTQLFYREDLSLYHCNDPFIDSRVSPLKKERFLSVADEFNYMRCQFSRLRKLFSDQQLVFNHKQARCAFCTQFMMGEMANVNNAIPQ